LASPTTRRAEMFKELTRELLDLNASVQGTAATRFAFVIDCCSCCCCGCFVFCR